MVEEKKLTNLINELNKLNDEKRNLKISLRESNTQISVLRSQLTQLKTIFNENKANDKIEEEFNACTITDINESFEMKQEINILQ